MSEQLRRKELRAQYKQQHPEAGVYQIINNRNRRILLGSTANLASLRNKLEFAQSTHTATVLDRRLTDDIREFGIEAFSMEVLDLLQISPEMTQKEILADLATLEQLWREKLDPTLLY